MAIETWLSFLIFCLVITSVPGPGCIVTVNHAMQHGWRSTLILLLGQESSLFIIMIAVSIGAKSIVGYPSIMLAIKIFGAIWLMYTAWSLWNSRFNDLPVGSIIHKESRFKRFMLGFITDITNAKAIALLITMTPSYFNVAYPMWTQVIIITMTLIITDAIVMLFYAISSSHFRLLFSTPNFVKIQNRVSAIILILIAIKIVI